jgi:asparagine synthase (glutamine-hydrolysing)
LDYRVVEFASKVPSHLKMKVLNEKYLLKQSAADLIPARVKQRPKQPYRAPEVKSFIGGGNESFRQPYVSELLSPARIQEYNIFNPRAVGMLIEKAKKGQATSIRDGMALVGILSTQLLVDQFIKYFNLRVSDGAE